MAIKFDPRKNVFSENLVIKRKVSKTSFYSVDKNYYINNLTKNDNSQFFTDKIDLTKNS